MLSFLIHFKELKFKVFYIFFCFFNTFAICNFFIPRLANIISMPLSPFINTNNFDFAYNNIFEVFNLYIFLSLNITLFFIIPVLLYFIISFLQPGFYSYEKQLFYNLFIISFRLLILSSFLCFVFLIPCTLFFLFDINIISSSDFIILKSTINLYDYSIFVCRFLFIYSYVVFQIPTLMSIFILLKKPLSIFFFKLRRFWIILSFIFGCFFSSSDFASFFFVSLTLLIFFEIFSILSVLKIKYSYAVYM